MNCSVQVQHHKSYSSSNRAPPCRKELVPLFSKLTEQKSDTSQQPSSATKQFVECCLQDKTTHFRTHCVEGQTEIHIIPGYLFLRTLFAHHLSPSLHREGWTLLSVCPLKMAWITSKWKRSRKGQKIYGRIFTRKLAPIVSINALILFRRFDVFLPPWNVNKSTSPFPSDRKVITINNILENDWTSSHTCMHTREQAVLKSDPDHSRFSTWRGSSKLQLLFVQFSAAWEELERSQLNKPRAF